MFKKILIANRGEIAVRIMRTCREMGIETIAVYSEADRSALHALCADHAVFLGGSDPAESYLNIDTIIQAAKSSGAEAIHPGYGFLAENASFAERCEAEGIVFIGPPARVIRDLGDKITARRIMKDGGVPIIPGMLHEEGDFAKMAAEAERIGYPVLIKAAAGGGGKGMRVVHDPGSAIHLLERECSIQRRHQKIIEETPSPVITKELRERMGGSAVAAARAAGYVNAGTVEFIVDEHADYYFLEVNTRLQVEHPVTEMITGLDLVRHQIEIAAGRPLALDQSDISGRGHAIECRIYAEDPENGFFPSPGTIEFMKEPAGAGVRNDCGVYQGFTVPVEYDPILSKLIVHAETRGLAIERMVRALREYVILGITTPVPFLIDVLSSRPFSAGETFTDFVDAHFSGWKPEPQGREAALLAFIIDSARPGKSAGAPSRRESAVPAPWETLGNWRM
jgi:acetyl/propionyl-CoA carboxylase alpha subunit